MKRPAGWSRMPAFVGVRSRTMTPRLRSLAVDRCDPASLLADPAAGIDQGTPGSPAPISDRVRIHLGLSGMLACHASQRAWLRRQHGMDDYLETMERWARCMWSVAGLGAAGNPSICGPSIPGNAVVAGSAERPSAPVAAITLSVTGNCARVVPARLVYAGPGAPPARL